nr:uncharacterized mitochondrial protein AtMg00810-like [Tanacetum cinerariifolium]
MVEKSKLDEDKEGQAIDPSHYRGMNGTLLYLTAVDPTYNLLYACVPGSMVSKGFFYCINSICTCGSRWLPRYTPQYIWEYQLADLFTKALGRDRIEFLINKLGMGSFKPETLKQLTDEVDE